MRRRPRTETGQVVAAANLNSPAQTVISGAKAAVEKAVSAVQGKGRTTRGDASCQRSFPLRTDAAGTGGSGAGAGGLSLADPRIPVAANVTGGLVTTAWSAQDALIRQVTGAVRWVDCMQALDARRCRGLCRSGSGQSALRLLKQIDPELKALNVEDAASLEKTLAELAV